jgi:hypothetical protein
MRFSFSLSAASLLALLLAPSTLGGQALPAQLQRLPLETEVRLELAGGEVLRGRITRQDSFALTIRRINRPSAQRAFLEHRIVALDSIVRGWRYGGNHWTVGTALGAAVGAIGMLMLVSGPLTDEAPCNVGCWLGAGGFGVVVGGGIGFLIGRAVPKWREVGAGP